MRQYDCRASAPRPVGSGQSTPDGTDGRDGFHPRHAGIRNRASNSHDRIHCRRKVQSCLKEASRTSLSHRTCACPDDPTDSGRGRTAQNCRLPVNEESARVPPRTRCHAPLRLVRRGSQHFLQRFLQHRRKRFPAPLCPPENAIAGFPAQKALRRRVRLQNLRLSRCDFFFGGRPSIPPLKRAMRGRNGLPGSLPREASVPLEVQEQKGYRRTGR